MENTGAYTLFQQRVSDVLTVRRTLAISVTFIAFLVYSIICAKANGTKRIEQRSREERKDTKIVPCFSRLRLSFNF